jgi:hypothetical protein
MSSEPVSTTSPADAYNQFGAVVYIPSGPGWTLMNWDETRIVFAQQYGSPQDSAIANTIIFMVEGFEDDTDFLNYIAEQREQQEDDNRYRNLSISHEHVLFKETSCLKYDALLEDHKDSGVDSKDFQYLKTAGYICRHPNNKAVAFQMEISHRSSVKAWPDGLLSIGEGFFNNIEFNDDGLE